MLHCDVWGLRLEMFLFLMTEHLYTIIVKIHYDIIVQLWIVLDKQVLMLWTKTSP